MYVSQFINFSEAHEAILGTPAKFGIDAACDLAQTAQSLEWETLVEFLGITDGFLLLWYEDGPIFLFRDDQGHIFMHGEHTADIIVQLAECEKIHSEPDCDIEGTCDPDLCWPMEVLQRAGWMPR